MAKPVKSGIISSPRMNAFERTSVVNSDTATINALFVISRQSPRSPVPSHPDLGVAADVRRPGDAHEDVVQRGARDLEVVHRGPRRQVVQEALRLAREPDFLK